MEERIIDDPRKIKVKRNAVGGVEDATDELAPEKESAAEEEELILEIPEGMDELDEDLIGLAPSQLEKELARRKKEAEEMAAERDKLLHAADEFFKKEQYSKAEPLYAQASVMDPKCIEAVKSLWLCRTENLKSTERLLEPEIAQEFSVADDRARTLVLDALGGQLASERKALEEEAAPLRERVRDAQASRRTVFRDNRNYYRLRLVIFGAVFLALCIAAAVCAQYIARVKGSTPAIVTIVLGAVAVLDLIPVVIFARKYFVAQRFCTENERLSSTEEGEHLEELEQRLESLSCYLDD